MATSTGERQAVHDIGIIIFNRKLCSDSDISMRGYSLRSIFTFNAGITFLCQYIPCKWITHLVNGGRFTILVSSFLMVYL